LLHSNAATVDTHASRTASDPGRTAGCRISPSRAYARNEAWLTVSLVAAALLAWSQLSLFNGELQTAEPKTIRYRVLHVAACLVRRGHKLILRLDESWPWAPDLVTAFSRLRDAFP
jgi:hypothetical protein